MRRGGRSTRPAPPPASSSSPAGGGRGWCDMSQTTVLGSVVLFLAAMVVVQNFIFNHPELRIRGAGRAENLGLQERLRRQASEIAALKSEVAKIESRVGGSEILEHGRAGAKAVSPQVQQQPQPQPADRKPAIAEIESGVGGSEISEHGSAGAKGVPPQVLQQQQQQTKRLPTMIPKKVPADSSASSSSPKYFTVSYTPCKDGARKPVLAGICTGPSQRLENQCSIELVPGATTYGVDLPTTIANRPFWTKAQDEFGKRTVHINTHDSVTEDQYISKSILDKGTWDEYILEIFKHVLLSIPKAERRSKLVVDVGANIAYFSLTAASYGFRTISFEPMRFNLARILSSIQRNPGFSDRMVVYNMAVSNSLGALSLKATAKTNAGNFAVQANSQSSSDADHGSYGSDYVNSASLDEIINEDIVLMKIDVETFEPFVLDGARNLLCQNIVQHIIIEFDKNQRTAHGGACPPDEMMDWMDKLGYDVRDVIVGAPKINIKPLNTAKMPPNVWFSLRDASTPPAKRMGADGGVCASNV